MQRGSPQFCLPDAPANEQIDEYVPVLIVGGGPTGMAAGNFLGQAGIATLVIERNHHMSNSPRALSLDDEGVRICQAMGLGDRINRILLAGISPRFEADGRLLASIAPGDRRNGYPLISTFHQPEFEAILLDGLRRFPCVEMRFQHTVERVTQTPGSVFVSVRTPTGRCIRIGCNYLLACDGGGSSVRSQLGIPLQGRTYPRQWLVVDCFDDETEPTLATCFCNPARPAVTVPSPYHGRRWEFMLLPGEDAHAMQARAQIDALIRQAGGPLHSQVIRQAVYTFHSRLARAFSQGGVFLLGDAAHMMPPFAGQGLNSGLRDAHNLSWKLSLVLRDLASPQLLESYHEERYPHAARMIRFSSLLASLIMPRKRPLACGRNLLFQALNSLPPARAFLSEARIKPQPRYRHGFFLPAAGPAERALTGLLLPQPEVITQQGQRMLLDDALGSGFAIVRLHHHSREACATLAAVQSDFWRSLDVRCVCVQVDDEPHEGEAMPSTAAASQHGPHCVVVRAHSRDLACLTGKQCIVVRPDRFVLGAFSEDKADTFVSALQDLLCPAL